jgi:Spx/MgsR family transcriptional regulator
LRHAVAAVQWPHADDNARMILYGIPNCDSVKKARAWLAERGVEYSFHDFKKAGLPPTNLDGWIAAAGWERVLNRKGTTWRQLDEDTRAAVTDAASARALMRVHPTLVKRPVIEWDDGRITVGFNPACWT